MLCLNRPAKPEPLPRMIIEQFVDELRRRGVRLWIDARDKLHAGPAELLGKKEIEAINALKEGVIAAVIFEGRA